jgi:hypothetical protein
MSDDGSGLHKNRDHPLILVGARLHESGECRSGNCVQPGMHEKMRDADDFVDRSLEVVLINMLICAECFSGTLCALSRCVTPVCELSVGLDVINGHTAH